MHRLPRALRAAPLVLGGCILVNSNGPAISYDLQPQEFVEDFGANSGNLMAIACTDDTVCQQAPVPQGTTASCDTTAGKCVLHADVLLSQTINLSQQPGFPQSVANSSAIDGVTVGAVHYWTPANTLSFASPPVDIYVGSQTAQKETDPGVALLGTVPSLPAGARTACRNGAAGTQDGACDMPLTDSGTAALGALAKDYRTPFNVLVVAHVTVHAGDPLPSGKLDLFIQPVVAFQVK